MQKTKRSKKNGFSLVEVLIALALLAIVGGGFLMVLANSSSHTLTSDTRAAAESVARSQIESIKNGAYKSDATQYPKVTDPFGQPMPSPHWDVQITGLTKANGLQKVTVKVIFDGKTILTLEGYRSF